MTDNANGASAPGQTDQPQDQTALERAKAVIDARIIDVVATTVRGILTGMPGIQPPEVLNSVARVTGQVLAGTLSGNVQGMVAMRQGMRAAFEEGQRRVPLVQAALDQAKAAARS